MLDLHSNKWLDYKRRHAHEKERLLQIYIPINGQITNDEKSIELHLEYVNLHSNKWLDYKPVKQG